MRNLTVVIPILDERESIEATFDELNQALDALEGWRSEVIWVDDGSTDGSVDLLRTLPDRDPRHRVIRFRRNFGQTAALSAGFENATGSVIVTLDGDLQNDPADIPKLLEKLDEGYDIVNGWRRKRKDRFVTRILPSRLANWLISRITGVRLHDYGCTLKVYRADVARNLSLHGDLHRFIPALASWYGVDVAEVDVNHRPRIHGSSKYGIGRTVRVLVDLVTVKFFLDYAGRPGYLFGVVGIVVTTISTFVIGYLGIERLFFGAPLADRPLLLLGILGVVLGLQFVGIGLLAEMIMRASHEASGRRIYTVREVFERVPHAAERDTTVPAQSDSAVLPSSTEVRPRPPERVDDPADHARRQ